MKNIIKRQVYGLNMYRGCTSDAKAEVKCEVWRDGYVMGVYLTKILGEKKKSVFVW